MPIKRALISVYDKTGVVEFARDLVNLGVEIITTGGTSKALAQAGVPNLPVEEVTGFPEILDGRVKTLHPGVHAGILCRRDHQDDMQRLTELGIQPIDLVALNLYPFSRTAADPHASLEDVIEMIDIGGPAMLRSASKNYRWALPVCRPDMYGEIVQMLRNGDVAEDYRRNLAAIAFKHTSDYDRAVAAFLQGNPSSGFPDDLILYYHRQQELRYGENPHQRAAFYLPQRKKPFYRQLGGKELSFNNILDLEAAAGLAAEFEQLCVVLVKHTVPCGVAIDDDPVAAYRKAFATDTSSPYGGIVGLNRPLTAELAMELSGVFYEVIVAPGFEAGSLEILQKKKNLRLVELNPEWATSEEVRTAFGGLLVQSRDVIAPRIDGWKVATQRQPTESEWAALEFAWKVTRWAKSNAIVFAVADRTLGIGLGQTSRVDSVELAVARAKKYGVSLKDSVIGSDAFFPFPDGAEAAIKAGATAIIQPGGSVKDPDVIALCDQHGVAMVFTGERHFRH
ncbi:MAG: bifunctional phosphoribosylaminoimidazolecarboxamide formyltransferase/IMP cyclohydrolase [bacterium]|nr:bifunctional phosphoribosylaminoimidazolecarboxamide formyltransferase/IMP cyclohydrolase [bacterium]